MVSRPHTTALPVAQSREVQWQRRQGSRSQFHLPVMCLAEHWYQSGAQTPARKMSTPTVTSCLASTLFFIGGFHDHTSPIQHASR